MVYLNSIRSLTAHGLVAITGFAFLAGSASAERAEHGAPGAVYVLSNQPAPAGNSVLVYARASDGTLTFSGSVPTGGTGAGTGGDPLASQGAVTIASHYLFAVNAGSNDVSMFGITGSGLVLLDKEPSGGQMPVSVAVSGPLVYVLNAGATPNISGFTIDSINNRLVPLAGSQRPLAGGNSAAPADVTFNADGDILLVTEKGTQLIDTYKINFRGYASAPISHPSSGVTPFAVAVTNRGYAVVVEAASGAASSYDIGENGGLDVLSGSLGLAGQRAPCWVALTNDGRFAYTANAASGTLSSLAIAANGTLTLINPAAGTLAAPLDLAMTGNSKFLYVREGSGAVSGFKVEHDGSLTALGSWAGIPSGAQGIAAR